MEQAIQKRQAEKNAEALVPASNLPAVAAPSLPAEATAPRTEFAEQKAAHDEEMGSVKLKMSELEAELSKSQVEVASLK